MSYKTVSGTQQVRLLDQDDLINTVIKAYRPELEQPVETDKSIYMALRNQIDQVRAKKEQETKETIIEGLESLLNIL